MVTLYKLVKAIVETSGCSPRVTVEEIFGGVEICNVDREDASKIVFPTYMVRDITLGGKFIIFWDDENDKYVRKIDKLVNKINAMFLHMGNDKFLYNLLDVKN